MFLFEITVTNVKSIIDEMGITSATDEGVEELIASLDKAKVIEAALKSTNFDTQTNYAQKELTRQVNEAMQDHE